MTAQPSPTFDLWAWRHPRAIGAAGRCIGRTDLAVDRRKAKRLAARIRQAARRHGLPREIWTSPLRRAFEVGTVLRGWGWKHRVDIRLIEMDFGCWDGRSWREIAHADVARWEANFVQHAPGGGESQATLRWRIGQFLAARAADDTGAFHVLVVTHAGWIGALLADGEVDNATHWPAPTPQMGLRRFGIDPSGRSRTLDRSL